MWLTTGEVTSLAEVWIEIRLVCWRGSVAESLPLRKCGLKFSRKCMRIGQKSVTSLAEVWIEIVDDITGGDSGLSHFPCGSVD